MNPRCGIHLINVPPPHHALSREDVTDGGSVTSETTLMTPGGSSRSAAQVMKQYMESLPRDVPPREEIRHFHFWASVRSEFLGSLLLVIFGCGASIENQLPPVSHSTASDDVLLTVMEIKIALAFGLAAAVIVQCFDSSTSGPRTSPGSPYCCTAGGVHANPAVTLSFLVTRRISSMRAAFFVFAQCVGAILGAAILYGLSANGSSHVSDAAGLGATVPLKKVHGTQAFGMEFMGTLLVVLATLATSEQEISCRPLCVGAAYASSHLLTFRWTGSGLNPARCLGPALITNTWESHWVYWVGPMLSGILGGFTYEYIREGPPRVDASSHHSSSVQCSTKMRCKTRTHDPLDGPSSNDTELTATSTDCHL